MGNISILNLEDDLNNIKKKNSEIKRKNYEMLYNNPSLQLISNYNLYYSDLNNNENNINDNFSNINDKNNKDNLDKLEEIYNKSNNDFKEIGYYKYYTILKEEYEELKGLFFYRTEENEYEIDILKIFNELLKEVKKNDNEAKPDWYYKKLPFRYNLLLCNEDLNESEIYTFFIRAINCDLNCLYIIVLPEEMNIKIEKIFFRILSRLINRKNYNNIKSCIIVLYIDLSSHILKQLINIKEKNLVENNNLFDDIYNKIKKANFNDLNYLPVEIVTSDSPAVGKTTYILKEIESNKDIFKSFPLGNVDKQLLRNIAYSINQMKGNDYSVIFQLYQNPDENSLKLIKKFLFQFIILKAYDLFDFATDKRVNIYIEVSTDYENFSNDYIILKLFKKKEILLNKNLKDSQFYTDNPIDPNKIQTTEKFNKIIFYLDKLKKREINKQNIPSKLIQGLKYSLSTNNDLIKDFFINKFYNNSSSLPNFQHLNIFVKLLYVLIIDFEECSDINPENLAKVNLNHMRGKIIEYYIDLILNYIAISYDSILENQKKAAENQNITGHILTDEDKEKLIKILNKKNEISYDLKKSVVFFNKAPSFNLCTILTTSENNKEYNELNKLSEKIFKQSELISIQNFADPHFKLELASICLTIEKSFYDFGPKIQNYFFTIDNFIKMVLIYLRIRANIPLILLGETGCGKTCLIETLCYFLVDRYELIQKNINSGTTYKDILKFLKEQKLLKNSISNENKNKNKNKNIILFLDEINTTNCLNLLVELFNNHSFVGQPLKDNIYIIAACNPYRLMLSKVEEIGYANKKRHKIRNLIYTVNPLPLSLINYIFDFGNLSLEHEKKYIKKFINSFLKEHFKYEDDYYFEKFCNYIVDLVHECHIFIKDKSEVSSVSLREIKRFKQFYEFFEDITLQKYGMKQKSYDFKNDADKEKIIILRTVNISLFICYYLRIVDRNLRKELEQKLDKKLKEFCISEKLKEFTFLEYPEELENEIVDSMNINKGIAKNKALLDNIFSIFVCLNLKIPIIICGKAGCSKTLSFSLLCKSMQGEYSENEFFKKYPSLNVNSYQGSLTSNSFDIQTIFKRAKMTAKNQEKNSLSVILFDEMGLAEISPYNPLKVIHEELDNNDKSELDDKNKIGFVGISNWTLDASKMNRVIHLSIQEPDKEDLKKTSLAIGKGIDKDFGDIYKEIITQLAESYYEYKEYLKNNYFTLYDFHGARDFYFLIKNFVRMLRDNGIQKSIENIAMDSIESNFGGIDLDKENMSSTKKFKIIFSEIRKNINETIEKYDVFSCLSRNLKGNNNRYLLLITDKTKNDTLVEYILKKLELNYRLIQGSKLKADQNESYVIQKAYSIISAMKNGEIIILKDMEITYPKFYELFNQNLDKIGNSLYANVVLDSTTNEKHIVDDKFRCIVLLEKDNVNEQDPPFINRFEKHLISFKYILTEKQNVLAEELYQEIIDLTSLSEKNEKKNIPLLININIEEIRSLILELSFKNNNNENIEENIIDIYKLLIPTFSQENVLSSLYAQKIKYINNDEIKKIYDENSHTNIYDFMKNVKKNKLIVYTFSPYYNDIFSENNIIEVKNEYFGTINKEKTLENRFNEKLSENILYYFFNLYYENSDYNLFIIHFKVKDTKYLKYIKLQLEDYLKNKNEKEKEKEKIILFVIHIEKENALENLDKYHSNFLSFISEYQQITIDNLSDPKNISIIELFDNTNETLLDLKDNFNNKNLFDIDSIIKKNVSKKINKNKDVLDKLNNLSENGIIDCIIESIKNLLKNSENILRKSLLNIKDYEYDFINYFKEKYEKYVSDNIQKLIDELINNGFLVKDLFEKNIPKEIKNTITTFIMKLNVLNISINNNINIKSSVILKIPGSKLLFKKLIKFIGECKKDYISKEDEYRKKMKINNESKMKTLEDVQFEKKQYLKSNLWNEELLSENFMAKYSQEIIEDFIDYFLDSKYNEINENQKKFLLFLYNIKNKSIDNVLDRFLYFSLWIVNYKNIIFNYLDFIKIIDNYSKDKNILLDLINMKYKEYKNIEDENKEKVNGIFYRISEIICEILIDANYIQYNKIENIEKLYKEINIIPSIFTQFNLKLSLSLKKHYSLIIIMQIIDFYLNNKEKIQLNEQEFKNKFHNFINNMNEEYKVLKDNNSIEEAITIFKNQIDFVNLLSSKLAIKIFENKLLEYIKNDAFKEYKLELVKILFEYPDLLKHSFLFFNYLFLMYFNKPKKQIDANINKKDINQFSQGFNQKDDKKEDFKNKEILKKILKKIDEESENNEILKEILIYIFELRINEYFEDCLKSKYIKKFKNKEEKFKKLLLELNFEYFKISCNKMNIKNFETYKTLDMLYYIAFIRVYLFYFVDLQLKISNADDIEEMNKFHENLFNIINSNLGKLISLYIGKLFILKNEGNYFMNKYLERKEIKFNWKNEIIKNKNEQFFSIDNYDTSNHLLFDIWNELNTDNLKGYIKKLDITDLSYILNCSYNEIRQKQSNNKDKLEKSKLLEEICKINDNLKINDKTKLIIGKISDLSFFK